MVDNPDDFDEAKGQEVVNDWFLQQVTSDDPPSVRDLYIVLQTEAAR